MAYLYKDGFRLNTVDTLASPTHVFISDGLALDLTVAEWQNFSKCRLLKTIGLNYIYITADGEIYNSAVETSDCLVLTVQFGSGFEIITAFNPDNNIDYDAIIESLTNALVDLENQIDDIINTGFVDTISEVINETLVLTNDTMIASFTVESVIDMYVVGMGELELTSINNINGTNVVLADALLNGESINISYNTNKTI